MPGRFFRETPTDESVKTEMKAQPTHATQPAVDELDAIRREIDRIDADLLELIHRRLGLAASTLAVKQRLGLGPADARREAEVVRRAAARARERGIEPESIREIFWRLIELSRAASPRRMAQGPTA